LRVSAGLRFIAPVGSPRDEVPRKNPAGGWVGFHEPEPRGLKRFQSLAAPSLGHYGSMKSKIIDHGDEKTYVLVFDPGDEAMDGLLAFSRAHGLTAAHFTAIGGFNHVALGYFDRARRDYDRTPIAEQVEVLSLIGDVAVDDGNPRIHAHAVIGLSDLTTRGGHLIEGRVWPTLEVVLQESPAQLRRRSRPELGIALIDLPE
jgi:uncharacterized protein